MKKIILTTIVILITLFAVTAQNKIYDFPFNGSRSTSIGTGTFSSTGTSFTNDRSGNANSALQTASGFSTATLTDLPTGHSARTIAFYFNRQGAGNTTLCSYGTNNQNSFFSLYFNAVGALQFRSGGGSVETFGVGVPYNTWHYLVITYDETNIRIYLNGFLGLTVAKNLNTANSVFQLGDMYGYFDELKIYEGALSAAQVTDLFNNGNITSTPKPTIAVTANPTTAGIVTGTGVYTAGDTVTLRSSTYQECTFLNWEENGTVVSTDTAYTFTVSGNRHLTANFLLAPVVNIPDANFKNLLLNSLANTNSDTEIQVYEAIAFTSGIGVNGLNITDLTGIEAFVNLTVFACSQNQLTSVDFSSNTALVDLNCSQNQLTSLILSNNTALKYLNCSQNQLTSLTLGSNTALKTLNCFQNQLTSLDVSNNTVLEYLGFGQNQLTSLDVSNNTLLETLDCYQNQLTSLNLSSNTVLYELDCSQNPMLTSLNVANGNNTNMYELKAQNTPNLSCIQVDDSTYSTNNWIGGNFSFDVGAVFSTNCSAITSINNISLQNTVTIFPSPVSTTLNILLNTQGETSIELYDLAGKQVKSAITNNTQTVLNVEELNAGIYFLRITNGNEVFTSKLVKE